jgi:hypothetical protein
MQLSGMPEMAHSSREWNGASDCSPDDGYRLIPTVSR